MANWLMRCGDALSQLVNVVLLNGQANESVSGRAYRCNWQNTEATIDFVLGFGHCRKAYGNDLLRAQQVIDIHADVLKRKGL